MTTAAEASAGAPPPALELVGVDKRFGPVHANRAVSLRIAAGTVHAIIGENGAGKSTLMNIVFGYHQADDGEIRIHGRPVRIRRPHDAIAAGVGMVHQHFMLVEAFTALENIVLGAEGGLRLAGGLAGARASLERLAADYGLSVPLDRPVGELPVGLQQRVEILKALHRGARLLILDEPTAMLTPGEADQLFALLRRLRDEGKTVLLVTHKLREVMAVSDRVTVMRQGAVVADLDTRSTSPAELAEKMVGRAVQLQVGRTPARPGAVLLEARGLGLRDRHGIGRLRGVSLALRAGEIVGIAGVAGNGQTELLEVLAGMRRPDTGEIHLGGRELVSAGLGPKERRELGLAHVPEDRLAAGLVGAFPAWENALLGYHRRAAYGTGPLLSPSAAITECERRMETFDVRPRLPRLRASAFSGGNQQKLVLAREIESGPSVLLVGQPTRGVDIGAIEAIHRRLLQLRDAGKALLLVSVELDEILGLADRILVMHDGAIVGERPGEGASEREIGLLMAGGRPESA